MSVNQEGHVLVPGRGADEFCGDELRLQPGAYLVDSAIEQLTMPGLYDHQDRRALLLVNPGKVVCGN